MDTNLGHFQENYFDFLFLKYEKETELEIYSNTHYNVFNILRYNIYSVLHGHCKILQIFNIFYALQIHKQ